MGRSIAFGTAAWLLVLPGCGLLDGAKKAAEEEAQKQAEEVAAELAKAAAQNAAAEGAAAQNVAAQGEAPAGAVAGSYSITAASNPGGAGSYKGTLAVTQHGPHYALDWTIPGSASYKGVAIQSGNWLGVGWGMGSNFGVVVYKVAGGTLTGTWTTAQTMGKIGTEVLEGPPGLNGTYKITAATNAGGPGTYTGTVNITPTGDTHKVTWNVKPAGYSGTGILKGDTFIVGWGVAGQSAGVVAYDTTGGGLNGTWAAANGSQLGTEVLAKN